MNDATTDAKPYVTGTRREYRAAGGYRYRLITHRADCVYGQYMRQRSPADKPAGEMARCCRDKT